MFLAPSFVAELSLAPWLLLKGVNDSKWKFWMLSAAA
jgi:hypothetical protein